MGSAAYNFNYSNGNMADHPNERLTDAPPSFSTEIYDKK